MAASESEQPANFGFMRSAVSLIACTFVVAVLLIPVALQQSGSGGLGGLLVAGGMCLLSGLAAELIHIRLTRGVSPLAGQLGGMAARMFVPLSACLVLAVQGFSGRQNLAFVCYLLAFYLAMLALETRLAVKRVSSPTTPRRHSAR